MSSRRQAARQASDFVALLREFLQASLALDAVFRDLDSKLRLRREQHNLLVRRRDDLAGPLQQAARGCDIRMLVGELQEQ